MIHSHFNYFSQVLRHTCFKFKNYHGLTTFELHSRNKSSTFFWKVETLLWLATHQNMKWLLICVKKNLYRATILLFISDTDLCSIQFVCVAESFVKNAYCKSCVLCNWSHLQHPKMFPETVSISPNNNARFIEY